MPFPGFPFPPVDKAHERFLNSQDGHAGHPTAPGLRDEVAVARAGRPSPGNGMPGVPRIHTAPRSGPGIPGNTPTGPMQPGTEYNEGEDTGE